MSKKKFSECSKEEQLQLRKEAYKRWSVKADDSDRRLTKIGLDLGMTKDQIQFFKIKDKWEERFKKTQKKAKVKISEEQTNVVKNLTNKEERINQIDDILNNSGIPEQWQLFVMFYLQNFNANTSARLAGYDNKSKSVAFNILNDERTKKTIKAVKKVMEEDIYITAKDIISEYIRIAFADMTDYVEFDKYEVKLKNSQDVDGRLITEVKQGRDGVTIKLADKMKAIERLEKLFDAIPDRKLLLEQEKFKFTKQLAEDQTKSGNKVVIINDL